MADNYKVFDKAPVLEDTVSIHGHSIRKREIALGAVALVALIVCVVLAVLLAVAGNQSDNNSKDSSPLCRSDSGSVCFEPTCMRSAASVLETMDATVDPCNNFHEYVCGSYAQHNPLKPDVSQLTPAYNIYYENQVKLRRLMETPIITDNPWASEKKLKDYFASCTDHYGAMLQQGRPFLDQVVAHAQGWYVIGTFDESTYNFQQAMHQTHVDFWTDALFTFSLRTDWLNWKRIAVEVGVIANTRNDISSIKF